PPLLAGEVVVRVGEHVPRPRADDAARDAPEREVDDDPGLRAARREPRVRHGDRDDDPDEDRERVDMDRQRPVGREDREPGMDPGTQLEEAPLRRRAGDAQRGHGCGVYFLPGTTPDASSAASSATPSTPRSASAETSAEPTIAPSAYSSTSLTWRPVE